VDEIIPFRPWSSILKKFAGKQRKPKRKDDE
jgi:hypothetical protein